METVFSLDQKCHFEKFENLAGQNLELQKGQTVRSKNVQINNRNCLQLILSTPSPQIAPLNESGELDSFGPDVLPMTSEMDPRNTSGNMRMFDPKEGYEPDSDDYEFTGYSAYAEKVLWCKENETVEIDRDEADKLLLEQKLRRLERYERNIEKEKARKRKAANELQARLKNYQKNDRDDEGGNDGGCLLYTSDAADE